MVQKAKQDGADFVKVQKRNVEKFYTLEQLDSSMILHLEKHLEIIEIN